MWAVTTAVCQLGVIDSTVEINSNFRVHVYTIALKNKQSLFIVCRTLDMENVILHLIKLILLLPLLETPDDLILLL